MADPAGVDAPNTSVVLEPSESLAFHLQPQTAPQAVLTIRNVSDSRKIAFKVKTTRPLRYLVRPNQGMLGPNGAASIMVILQQRDCDELLRLDPSERTLSNDKFLVQSIYADDAFYESVKTKAPKEMADELTYMWSATDKKSLSNKKLRCRFVQDANGNSADASGAAGATAASMATATATSGGNDSPNKRLLQTQASIYSSSNTLLPQQQAPAVTPAQLSAALLQDGAPTAATKHEPAKDAMADVATLRKKYDELVAFTIQLTAQRDVLMTDLDKTRQLVQKASADAQRSKKLAADDVAGAASTLRQRKPTGGVGSSDETAAGGSAALNRSSGRDPAAFGLFHLLVCAIIFFLVGRYA